MTKLTAYQNHYQDLILQYSKNTSEDILYQCSELGKQFAKIGVASDEIVHFHHHAITSVSSQLGKQAILDANDMLIELALHQKLSLEREISAHQKVMLEIERKKFTEQSIISAFPDIIIKLSPRFELVDANGHFFTIFGYKKLSETNLKSLFQCPDAIMGAMIKSLSSGMRESLTENIVLADGQICPSQISILSLMDSNCNKDGMLLIIRDLRESIDSEKRIIMAKQMVFNVIETIPQRIYWLATDGKMLGCNSYFLADIGYSSLDHALNGLQYDARYEDIFLDKSVANSIISNQLPAYDCERDIVNALGESITIHEKAVPLKTVSGEIYGVICCYDDVTEIKQEQIKNQQLTQQLNQSQRLESIGKLSSSIAHDFNNMLSVILGYSQLLARFLSTDEQASAYEYVSHIISASEKAKHLTAKLLSFSKRDIQKLEIIELCQYLRDVLSTYKTIIGEDTQINLSVTDDCYIRADRTQLHQALLNLLVNARDAISDNDAQQEKTIEVSLTISHNTKDSDHQTVLMSVTDNGCGIAEDKLEYIFDPFYSTKKDLGTGLGLSTIYGIVEQNKADIKVTSQIGQGTTFSIYWPLCDSSAVLVEAKPQTTPAVPAATNKHSGVIYVVEDEHGVRLLMQALLEDAGYEVYVFENGSELINAMSNMPLAPDLLITDLILSEQLNGKLLAEQFNQKFPTVPVLYVSGYSHELVSKRGIILSDINFLKKPFEIDELINTVSTSISSANAAFYKHNPTPLEHDVSN